MFHFSLPPLPYGYDAFPKWIGASTVRYQYSQYHQAHVDKLNKAFHEISDAQLPIASKGIMSLQKGDKALERELVLCRFLLPFVHNLDNDDIKQSLGAHHNHCFFWSMLTPHECTEFPTLLKQGLTQHFGSVKAFIALFTGQALHHIGSGWVWFYHNEKGFHITTTSNEDNTMMYPQKAYPLLGLDLWEHAYQLCYKQDKEAYINDFWQYINWRKLACAYQKIKKLEENLYGDEYDLSF